MGQVALDHHLLLAAVRRPYAPDPPAIGDRGNAFRFEIALTDEIC